MTLWASLEMMPGLADRLRNGRSARKERVVAALSARRLAFQRLASSVSVGVDPKRRRCRGLLIEGDTVRMAGETRFIAIKETGQEGIPGKSSIWQSWSMLSARNGKFRSATAQRKNARIRMHRGKPYGLAKSNGSGSDNVKFRTRRERSDLLMILDALPPNYVRLRPLSIWPPLFTQLLKVMDRLSAAK